MSDVSQLLWLPWLATPWSVCLTLLVLVVALLGVRRSRRAWWRVAAACVLALFLWQPSVKHEHQQPVPDVAVVVVDDSGSQSLGARQDQISKALVALPAPPGVEVVIKRLSELMGEEAARRETALMAGVAQALQDIPPARLAGVVVLSDGQAHDALASAEALPPALREKPLHLLLSGSRGDRDHWLTVEKSPKFAIVGESVKITVTPRNTRSWPERRVRVRMTDLQGQQEEEVSYGEAVTFTTTLHHAGRNWVRIGIPAQEGELTALNNDQVLSINGVRQNMRVLLITGTVHPGQRLWRNFLKADPSIELVHFNILRNMQDQDGVPQDQLSLIPFPVNELFGEKLGQFDLVILDQYQGGMQIPRLYLSNIAQYVQEGGALLMVTGDVPEAAKTLATTRLSDVLPVVLSPRWVNQPFVPGITETGQRHPVTAHLAEVVAGAGSSEGAAGATRAFGQWFRHAQVSEVPEGRVVMSGVDDAPLLVLADKEQGRVATLLSDQLWLWERGFEGGGPYRDIVRNLLHWLLREPELEETQLTAVLDGTDLLIRRTSATTEPATLTLTVPDGTKQDVTLHPDAKGKAEFRQPMPNPGVVEVRDGERLTYAALDARYLKEFQEVAATEEKLAATVQATGGSVHWLEDGIPAFRHVSKAASKAGREWLGLVRNGQYTAQGSTVKPLIPAVVYFIGLAVLMLFAWRKEGLRKS